MWPVQEEKACLALRGRDFDLKRVCPKRVEVAGESHSLPVLRDEGLHWEGANRFAVDVDCEISGGWGGGAPIEEDV